MSTARQQSVTKHPPLLHANAPNQTKLYIASLWLHGDTLGKESLYVKGGSCKAWPCLLCSPATCSPPFARKPEGIFTQLAMASLQLQDCILGCTSS